jgi:nicotinate-nucleotide adenylyltransferase
MKTGLFGGTFNPIHSGHLSVAGETRENFDIEKIIFIPSATPPHKETWGVANIKDRYEMTRLAVSGHEHFTVSDVEAKRSGPSFTIDTVQYFRSTSPVDTELYFIMGIDAFLEIDTWKSYRDLFSLTPFIILARPGGWHKKEDAPWKAMENYLDAKISKGYTLSKSCYIHKDKQPVYIFDNNMVDISSTRIRELIKNGQSVRSMVPKKVDDFIKAKGLYI